jgi:preprotein translocase subunit SecY
VIKGDNTVNNNLDELNIESVVLAVFQSYGISIALQSQSAGDAALVTNPGFTFSLVTVATLTTEHHKSSH